jgi:hypothetical protein
MDDLPELQTFALRMQESRRVVERLLLCPARPPPTLEEIRIELQQFDTNGLFYNYIDLWFC